MRIGWATPINIRSAIGKYSVFACEELKARGHEVEIIRIESLAELELPPLPCSLPIVKGVDCDPVSYDVLVVNFGNHTPYHAGMMPLLARRLPLGVFHDIEMRHFEWGLHQRHNLSIPRLAGIEEDLAQRDLQDLVDPEARPLLATFAAMTSSAVIHGPHYLATISTYCPGPVRTIPLCFPDLPAHSTPIRPVGAPRITIFGNISEHKQPGRVLRAMAALRTEAGNLEFHLAGDIAPAYRDLLTEQAAALQITPPVFHGYVSDHELQAILESSTAICCLRYPVTEGSSASLATALYRGRPLIVSDVASFSLVPDDLAYKVSYGDDHQDLAAALRAILFNVDDAFSRGAAAKDWATRQFSATAYVDALEPLLREAPQHEQLTLAARAMTPGLLQPDGQPILAAVQGFASVLDWMAAAQLPQEAAMAT